MATTGIYDSLDVVVRLHYVSEHVELGLVVERRVLEVFLVSQAELTFPPTELRLILFQ
jgi:hypothetical protein